MNLPSGEYIESGYSKLRKLQFQEAIKEFERERPTADALCGLALVNLAISKLADAQELVEESLKQAPGNAEYLCALARIHDAAERPALALSAYYESLVATISPLSEREREQVQQALNRLQLPAR